MKNDVNNSKVVFVQYVPDECTKMATKFAYAQNKALVLAKVA